MKAKTCKDRPAPVTGPGPTGSERAGGVLYQISTLEALGRGCYDGLDDFAHLAGHGDFGLGTLDRLDGEMVALDGGFFQATADGKVHRVSPEMTTPFADLTFFKESLAFDCPAGLDYQGLQSLITRNLPRLDLFYAIRVHGLFSRPASGQCAPGRPAALSEAPGDDKPPRKV